MKKIFVLPFLLLLNGCVSQTATQKDAASIKILSEKEKIKLYAVSQIDGFINTIKPILMASLKSDPTGANGMDVCHVSAMELTKSYNKQLTLDTNIRRTALRYRNPANKPDAKDIEIMNEIIASKDFAPVLVEMNDSYRVYKPLPMAQPCMACHGDLKTMNPKTVAKIKKYYPNDLANGFKLGDFRGVVVAEIKK